MKQISSFPLLIVFALLIFASAPIECVASGTTRHSVPLKKERNEHKTVFEHEGERKPQRAILAMISSNEFQSDINPDDIISYEIWDESDNDCITSFPEDIPFCQYLFANPDDYCIKIYTAEYIYVGYISTIPNN